jgi:hypothetical protein
MARFLDEMRLKPWLDSKKLDIAVARPITSHEYRSGIETLLRQFKLAIRAA